MRIALICPSNMLFMPYVDNYTKILKERKVGYTIINWNRLHLEDEGSDLSYKDEKVGHQRGYLSYHKYSRYILKQLKNEDFDKVIVFGIQLTYFLRAYLIKEYKDKYIVDIRDHNKVLKLFNIKKSVEHSFFTTLSSPGYQEWLPKSSKYIINHNTSVNTIETLEQPILNSLKKPLNISYIGTITNLAVNMECINQLQNDPNYHLIFHGDGMINDDIERYANENKITNILVKRRYQKNEEVLLYKQADLVNMLLYGDTLNNKTCLSNRLYNAVINGKPLVALEGTYLSEVIKMHKLGVVLDSMSQMCERIARYVSDFSEQEYGEGRVTFLNNVIDENEVFKNKLKTFINEN